MTIRTSSEDDGRKVDDPTMADYMMTLTRVVTSGISPDRGFKCRTCNKEFKSFQALGGHRASHIRPKSSCFNEIHSPAKPKTHDQCSTCGLEFAIGQALGGHMRRHSDDANLKNGPPDDKDLAMVNCLMLLSRAGEFVSSLYGDFICNKCNRGFKPFQALGGHRIGQKPKTHDCSICGLMFAMGLALGGRMRRHRDGADQKYGRPEVSLPELVTENGGLCFDLNLTPYENDLNLWSRSYKTAFAV